MNEAERSKRGGSLSIALAFAFLFAGCAPRSPQVLAPPPGCTLGDLERLDLRDVAKRQELALNLHLCTNPSLSERLIDLVLAEPVPGTADIIASHLPRTPSTAEAAKKRWNRASSVGQRARIVRIVEGNPDEVARRIILSALQDQELDVRVDAYYSYLRDRDPWILPFLTARLRDEKAPMARRILIDLLQ